MTLSVDWDPGAEAALLRIPSWRTAARVAGAVLIFATTGVGPVVAVGGGHFELHTPGYVVRFVVRNSVLVVLGLFGRP
jgi:hypothetical protein